METTLFRDLWPPTILILERGMFQWAAISLQTALLASPFDGGEVTWILYSFAPSFVISCFRDRGWTLTFRVSVFDVSIPASVYGPDDLSLWINSSLVPDGHQKE